MRTTCTFVPFEYGHFLCCVLPSRCQALPRVHAPQGYRYPPSQRRSAPPRGRRSCAFPCFAGTFSRADALPKAERASPQRQSALAPNRRAAQLRDHAGDAAAHKPDGNKLRAHALQYCSNHNDRHPDHGFQNHSPFLKAEAAYTRPTRSGTRAPYPHHIGFS